MGGGEAPGMDREHLSSEGDPMTTDTPPPGEPEPAKAGSAAPATAQPAGKAERADSDAAEIETADVAGAESPDDRVIDGEVVEDEPAAEPVGVGAGAAGRVRRPDRPAPVDRTEPIERVRDGGAPIHGPQPAVRRPTGGSASPQWWRGRPGVIALIVLAILVIILIAVALDDNGSPSSNGATSGKPADHAITASRGDITDSAFDLLSGASTVAIRTGDLGGDLYRISTPVDSGLVPKIVTQTGRIQLQLVTSGQVGATAVDIQLSSAVRWTLRIAGGATAESLQLSNGKVQAIDFVAGATNIDVTLPKPAGTLPVRVEGGASQVNVHGMKGVPARATANNGAGQIQLGGVDHQGIAAGSQFDMPGWGAATSRYDIQLLSGVGVLVFDSPR
jgi:hypothetical protein